jgi:hypothetical protein
MNFYKILIFLVLPFSLIGCSNNFQEGDFTCREVWKKFEYIPKVSQGHTKYLTHTQLLISTDKKVISMFYNYSVGGVSIRSELIKPYHNCSNTNEFIKCKDDEDKNTRKDPMTKKDWILITNRSFELDKSSGNFTNTILRNHTDLEGKITSTERVFINGQCKR